MAWQAIVADRHIRRDVSGYKLELFVRYYDDADLANTPTPTNFLWEKTFWFDADATLTLVAIRAAVVTEGQNQRASMGAAQNALTLPQLAVGTTVAIP